MTSPLRIPFEKFVNDARKILAVSGTKAESSLYGPLNAFLSSAFVAIRPAGSWSAIEQVNAETLGIPDYRIGKGAHLHGWVEFKAVQGKSISALTGHDKAQVEKFIAGLMNFVVTTGWEWRLYRDGRPIGRKVVIGDESMFDAATLGWSVSDDELDKLEALLTQFLDAPLIPYPTAEAAVESLASRARGLKLALLEVGGSGAGPWLSGLRDDFAALLYKNGQPFTWERFVDSYVQIAVFGTLLWRLDTGKDVLLNQVVAIDAKLHPLLHECLDVLWKSSGRPSELDPLLDELCTTVNLIEPSVFFKKPTAGSYVPDPIVDAYEPFFRRYDAAARDANGVFYTPAQVVAQITSGVDYLLENSMGFTEGMVDPGVRFLDPATGTGTFLLGLLNQAAASAHAKGWLVDEAVREFIEDRCVAFEMFAGPYTIAHQRVDAALHSHGAQPKAPLPIYLADTLSAPESGTLPLASLGIAGQKIRRERELGDLVKTQQRILVILGNPPYERILKGGNENLEPFAKGLFEILRQATPDEYKGELKSTWDLFVAFWLWSLWELQAPARRRAGAAIPTIEPSDCDGMIAFITNRTWIIGNSLTGLRSLVRQGAKEVWILDLGGDARGSHGARSFAGGDGNVFPIQVGVAIAWVVFDRDYNGPPTVRYQRMYGTSKAKKMALAGGFDPAEFEVVAGTGTDPFIPVRWDNGVMAAAPAIDDLFVDPPQIGIQTARDKKEFSPVATDAHELYDVDPRTAVASGRLATWAKLGSKQRHDAWATGQTKRTNTPAPDPKSLSVKRLRRLAYKPLDSRWVYDDQRWIDWYRPDLRPPLDGGDGISLVTIPHDHGAGPAVMVVSGLMDQHVFRGSDGGNGVWFRWRPVVSGSTPDVRGVKGELQSGLSSVALDWLDAIGRRGALDEGFGYIVALLSAPSYTKRFWRAVEVDPLRVPLTSDAEAFDRIAELGHECLNAWLATDTSRAGIAWAGGGTAPFGKATFEPGKIVFENGRELSGVTPAMWSFEISGYPVLPKWFAAREHWLVNQAHATEALRTVIAVAKLVDLGPSLDAALSLVVD